MIRDVQPTEAEKQRLLSVALSSGTISGGVSALNRHLESETTQDMLERGYPSREKCEQILDWLGPED